MGVFLFPFFAAAIIACIAAVVVMPSLIIYSVFIPRGGVTTIIVVHVFALVVGSDFHAVVIGARSFDHCSQSLVCIIKQGFRVLFLSPRFILSGLRFGIGRVRRLRNPC